MTQVAEVLTFVEGLDIYPYLVGFAIIALAGYLFKRIKSAAK